MKGLPIQENPVDASVQNYLQIESGNKNNKDFRRAGKAYVRERTEAAICFYRRSKRI